VDNHYLENFKGRTPYIESESENSNSKETTPKSKTDSKSTKINNNTDFSSAFNEQTN
jgi:hypothetical protein